MNQDFLDAEESFGKSPSIIFCVFKKPFKEWKKPFQHSSQKNETREMAVLVEFVNKLEIPFRCQNNPNKSKSREIGSFKNDIIDNYLTPFV